MATKNQQQAPLITEEQASKAQAFLEKYQKAVIGGIIAIILIIVGIILFNNYYLAPRAEKADTELSKSQDLFGNGDYDKALTGFKKVADEYSSTKAGNLANLYIGLCYAQKEKWQDAANALEKFDAKSDQMISPAAEGALGNVYAHLKQYDKAVKHLTHAAEKADNNSLSPTFLIQAGEILESQGKKAEALKLYKQVKEKYTQSMYNNPNPTEGVTAQPIDAYIERATVE